MAPAGEAVPAGQGAHVEALVAPRSLLKVLGGHCVVLVVPGAVKEPGDQQRREPGALYCSEAQAKAQEDWPVRMLYLPAACLVGLGVRVEW